MKSACVFLVLLIAVTSEALQFDVVQPESNGAIVVNGYGAKGMICADGSNVDNVGTVACNGGNAVKLDAGEWSSTYEWSTVLTCTGNEASLDLCPDVGGPVGTATCTAFIGCA